MTQNNQEIEVKFYISRLPEIQARLQGLGADPVQPRTHEVNLRFDTASGDLMRQMQVLRLRQDSQVRITFKGPGQLLEGTRLRQEIEFTVSDFESARLLLEALGYQVVLIYEKFRTTFDLGEVHVTLDEMPYGNFVEIEGPDPESIRQIAKTLGLDWEARILDSYTILFERLREVLGFTFRDLSFANFAGIHVTPSAFALKFGDQG
jgi:adenylate cyclase, class 2